MRRKVTHLALVFPLLLLILTSCQESKEKRYARELREYTERNCPQPITPEGTVVLDSLNYSHPQGTSRGVVTYFYSVKTDSTGVESLQAQREKLYASLLQAIKDNVDMKKMKDDGLTIRHIYRLAETGATVLDFRFTAKDYK